jgi:hypothetical protein
MSQSQGLNQSTDQNTESQQESANTDNLMAEVVQNIETNEEGRELNDDELDAIAGGQRGRANAQIVITIAPSSDVPSWGKNMVG